MGSILQPGYLRWDGFKYVLDPTVEIVGPAGPPGPTTPGPAGPQGIQGPPGPGGTITYQPNGVNSGTVYNTWAAAYAARQAIAGPATIVIDDQLTNGAGAEVPTGTYSLYNTKLMGIVNPTSNEGTVINLSTLYLDEGVQFQFFREVENLIIFANNTATPVVTLPMTLAGTFHVINGSPNVVSTVDLQEYLPVGTGIVFSSQLGTQYTVETINGTSFTISPNYSGTTNTATTGLLYVFGGEECVLIRNCFIDTNGSLPSDGVTFDVSNGSPNVTASASETRFISAGSVIQFFSQYGAPYTVLSIDGTGTHIVLTTNYSGTSNSATAWAFAPPFWNVTQGYELKMLVLDNTTLGNSPTLQMDSTSAIVLDMFTGSSLQSASLVGPVGSIFRVGIDDTSQYYTPQNGFYGTIYGPGLISQAANVAYSPENPSDWSPIPTQVQAALDELATRSEGGLPAGSEGDLVYYHSGAWIVLPPGTDNYVLTMNETDPQWAAPPTGLPTGSEGDLVYYHSGSWRVLSPGASGTVLTMGATDPGWAAAAGGTTKFGTYASRPSPGSAGNVYIASDGIVQFVDDGTEWRPLLRGVPGWEPAPGNSISAYTFVEAIGGPTSTTNVQGGCIYLTCPSADGNSLVGYEQPKTSGQNFTVHMVPGIYPSLSNNEGLIGLPAIWVRNTSNGFIEGIFFGDTGYLNNWSAINVYTYTALNAFDGNPAGAGIIPVADGIWMHILDSGTTLTFGYSYDGVNWINFYTDSGTFISGTGNRYGFGVDPSSQASSLTVDSLKIA